MKILSLLLLMSFVIGGCSKVADDTQEREEEFPGPVRELPNPRR